MDPGTPTPELSGAPQHRVAVVLAGGAGTRMGGTVPKQLLPLAGETVLERSLRALHDHPEIDEVLVVMAPGHRDAAEALTHGRTKVTAVLEGGATRSDSTVAALDHLGDRSCQVLFHDAARPLVGAAAIDACLDALRTAPAVTVAVPSTDTVVVVDEQDRITAVPDRRTLRRVQTPQGFWSLVLREAYRRAAADPTFVATDDAGVVLRYLPDVPVLVVPGHESNLKVTGPDDLRIAEALLDARDPARGAPGSA